MMKYTECMICYSRYKMEVGPWPDKTGWSDKFQFSVGACNRKVHEVSDEHRLILMLLEFNHAVVRDKVPVEVAHAAFMGIEEYRDMMAGDIEGSPNVGILA